jgi:hypothetical protein
MSDDLPTPLSTLESGLCRLVRCKACRRRDYADVQKVIDSGRGDVLLIRLRYRYSNCPLARSSPIPSPLRCRPGAALRLQAGLGGLRMTAATSGCDSSPSHTWWPAVSNQ